LPESITEGTKRWQQNGTRPHSIRKVPIAERRVVGGDGAKDGTTAEPAAKKLFLGIERKGKELKRQISGEVRKLAGGSKKTGKMEIGSKSFLPRLERKDPEEPQKVQGNGFQGRGDPDTSTWKRRHKDSDGTAITGHRGRESDAIDSKRVRGHTETMTIDDMKGKGSGRRFSLDATPTDKNPIQKPALSQSQQAKGYKSGEPNRNSRHPEQNSTISLQTVIPVWGRHPKPGPGNSSTLHPVQGIEEKPSSHRINNSTLPKLSDNQPLSKPLDPDSVPPTEPEKYNQGGNSRLQTNRRTDSQTPSTESSPINSTMTEGKTATHTQVTRQPGMNDNLTAKTPTPSALDFWAEADSTLSSAHARSYDQHHPHRNSFWAEADKAVPLPPWKRERPSLEEWIAGLPGVGDGASDSKVFGTGKKLKKKDDPEVGVLRVVNGNAEDEDKILFDEDGNEVAMASDQAPIVPTVKVDRRLLFPSPQPDPSALPNFPRPFQPGRLEILPEASQETSLHTPTVLGGISTNKTLTLLSHAQAENSKIEEDLKALLGLPLPTEKLYRPADLARDVSSRLDTLEKYWDEQGVTVGTVLKRMLWIVDSMVVKEREGGQRERRAQEMGWVDGEI